MANRLKHTDKELGINWDEEVMKPRRADAAPLYPPYKKPEIDALIASGIGPFEAIRRFSNPYDMGRFMYVVRKGRRPGIKDERKAINDANKELRKELREKKMRDPAYAELTRKRAMEHYLRNKEKCTASNKRWIDNNKEKFREWNRKWHKNKRSTDPNYNIRNRLCSRMWHALFDNKSQKSKKTEELVGCSVKELLLHLENLLPEGIDIGCLKNRDMHIDHIVPCRHFDLSQPRQQMICFNWRNLRPLPEKENISKKDTFPDDLDYMAHIAAIEASLSNPSPPVKGQPYVYPKIPIIPIAPQQPA